MRGSRPSVAAFHWLLLILAACGRAPYPAPPAHPVGTTDAPRATPRDEGDEGRIRGMERQCRTRLSGETAEAALAALDRVREVLGSGCDLETVAHDPLHWRLRCRSDALFQSGKYQLTRTETPCAELQGARVHPWTCVGAVLRGLVGGDSSLATLQLSVMGHVDYQLLKPGSASHVCTELQTALGFVPPGRWEKVVEDAPDEERLYANNQLAWCRAANVAAHVRTGMGGDAKPGAGTGTPSGTDASLSGTSAGSATDASGATPPLEIAVVGNPPSARRGEDSGGGSSTATPSVELAVVGMATSWLASQKEGVCPSHGKARTDRPDCPEARRVDVLVRFSPRADVRRSTCSKTEPGTEAALWCLEDCMEHLALGGGSAGSDVTPEAAPLFVDGKEDRGALPVGWYVQRVPAPATRKLALGRVCAVLGVHDPLCATR